MTPASNTRMALVCAGLAAAVFQDVLGGEEGMDHAAAAVEQAPKVRLPACLPACLRLSALWIPDICSREGG